MVSGLFESDALELGGLRAPVLVFGGPYSNLEATLAMRAQADRLGIGAANIICTGDTVAYCADPDAVVSVLREWGIAVVLGNCEQSLSLGRADCGCGFEEGSACSVLAAQWYEYASRHLDASHRLWMQSLAPVINFRLRGQRFAVIHGGLRNINEFVFASSSVERKRRDITTAQTDNIIAGHCGLPFGQRFVDKHWLNAGVIGMPANDGTMDGWYLLLDQNRGGARADWHRLAYDAPAAARKMRDVNLSPEYGRALLTGLWPSMDVLPEAEQSQRGTRLEMPPLDL